MIFIIFLLLLLLLLFKLKLLLLLLFSLFRAPARRSIERRDDRDHLSHYPPQAIWQVLFVPRG